MKKPKRFVRGLKNIRLGQPDFSGEIIHRGPYKLPKGTRFSISPQTDLGDNPENILFCVDITIPIKDNYIDLCVDISDSFIPRNHAKEEEYLIPAHDLCEESVLGKKITVSDIFAFVINTSKSASLRIESSDGDPKNIAIYLNFERFKVVGSIRTEDVPGAAEFWERRFSYKAK